MEIAEKTVALQEINLQRIYHRDKWRIGLRFGFNSEFTTLVKTLSPSWSQTCKCWYVNDTEFNLKEIHRLFWNIAQIKKDAGFYNPKLPEEIIKKKLPLPAPAALSDEAKRKVLKFKYWLQSKRYSENTVKTYIDGIQSFLKFYPGKAISELDNNDIIVYNNEYIIKNKLSASYQNQVVNAIKLFFRKIEDTNMDIDLIHRPKRPKLLPNVLSKEEVKMILHAHNNIKHRVMLSLIYSCGLRCGELIRLRPEDVDSKRKVLIIRQAKGRKDRIAPLSIKIIEMLRTYYIACKPEKYLFEGQEKGEQYTSRSLQLVLKQALEKTNINKPVSLHWLRHSYATHLLENGTDLRYIQEILGHSSSKTTEIYTHVSTKNIQQITSPFDYL